MELRAFVRLFKGSVKRCGKATGSWWDSRGAGPLQQCKEGLAGWRSQPLWGARRDAFGPLASSLLVEDQHL